MDFKRKAHNFEDEILIFTIISELLTPAHGAQLSSFWEDILHFNCQRFWDEKNPPEMKSPSLGEFLSIHVVQLSSYFISALL